jgi:amino acid transporter
LTSSGPPPVGLARKLRSLDFFAVAFGSIIGVGWVATMGDWLTNAGPVGAMLAFALGGAIMFLIGLCYAELTAAMPVAGGEIAFSYRAFGLGKAAMVGWLLTMGYIAVSGFEALAVGRTVAYLVPATNSMGLYEMQGRQVYLPHLILGILGTILITTLNYRGVKTAARFQVVLTAILIVAGVIFIVAALGQGSVNNIEPAFSATPMVGLLAVFVTTPLWFVGFDIIPQAAEESLPGFPARRLGVLILIAIAAATVFYVLVILSVSMLLPWQDLVGSGSELPTAEAFRTAFTSPWLANLVLIAAIVGLLTSWNGFFLAATRVLYSLGRARVIPSCFGEAHPRYGTPHRAVLLVGGVTLLAPFLGHQTLGAMIDVSSACLAAAFFGACMSMWKLRCQEPDMVRPYRVAGGKTVALAAAAGALLILVALVVPGSGVSLDWQLEWPILIGWAMLGVILWFAARPLRTQVSEEQRAAAILQTHGDQQS